MGSNKRVFTPEQLLAIRDKLQALLHYVQQNDKRPLPRCFQYCRIIIKNISACVDSHYQHIGELSRYIHEDWASAMEIHTGLPEYYIPFDCFERQYEINTAIKEMIVELDKIIF